MSSHRIFNHLNIDIPSIFVELENVKDYCSAANCSVICLISSLATPAAAPAASISLWDVSWPQIQKMHQTDEEFGTNVTDNIIHLPQ